MPSTDSRCAVCLGVSEARGDALDNMFVRDAEIPPPSSERLRCRQAAQELTSKEGRHMW